MTESLIKLNVKINDKKILILMSTKMSYLEKDIPNSKNPD